MRQKYLFIILVGVFLIIGGVSIIDEAGNVIFELNPGNYSDKYEMEVSV